MPDTQTDWHAAGCARDCSEQHTYKLGRCALATEQPPEPTVSISRVETMADGWPGIVLRSIPASVWDGLIAVAAHVSAGRGFASVGQGPYPDAKARRVLGALHDAGLLPRPEEPAAQPEAATQPHTGLVVQPYRERGEQKWVFRCWGMDDGCDGLLSLDHYSEQSAERARDRHVAEEHAEPAEPATVTDPEYLRRLYAQAIRDTPARYPDDIADAVMRVRDGYVAQLVQRLELADQAHRQAQQRADRFAADLTGWRNLAAEHQQATIAALERADRLAATLRQVLAGYDATGCLNHIQHAEYAAVIEEPAAHNAGPTVAEAAVDDRRWPLEKHGE